MAVRFNAEEVLNMGIKIEENGAAFYRKAASTQSDEGNRKFLENLAGMEDEHKRTFTGMKESITPGDKEEKSYDPYDEISLYLDAMADAHGGEGSPDVAASLTGDETMKDIVNIALDLEKKSILYYVGMKERVPQRLGRDKIDSIIGEERKHVAQLRDVLKKL